MKRISIVLYALLVLQVFSDVNEDAIFTQDTLKCNQPNYNPLQISTEACTSINPLLESTGSYKGKCCRVTANMDPLVPMKIAYHENWKKTTCQLYGVDESISDDELRKLVYGNKPKDQCQLLLDYGLTRTTSLYASALLTEDKKVQYNCGDGEQTFYLSDFVPKNELEALSKDIYDCNNSNENYLKKNCYKQGNKLMSDIGQCCWCETNLLGQGLSASSTKACTGFNSNTFRETLNSMRNSHMNSGLKMNFNCRCTNKRGETITASFDTISSDVVIN
jgi:hypothetical protein